MLRLRELNADATNEIQLSFKPALMMIVSDEKGIYIC